MVLVPVQDLGMHPQALLAAVDQVLGKAVHTGVVCVKPV
jgi:hypothetical protein